MGLEILESEQNKPFKVRGIFMRKDVVSKNGKHYSSSLVEQTVQKIQESIKQNGSYPISMMADHPGITSNQTLSVVGRVTNAFIEGNNAMLEAEIANTSIGKDVQELIRGRFVEGLSIRASKGKFKNKYIGGKLVKDVLEMELKGVDLVVNPGVDGARITDIIESDQSNSNNLFISIEEEENLDDKPLNENEEDNMTLEELKQKYPNLVESLKQEHKSFFESEFKVSELTESANKLVELQESFESTKAEKEKLEIQLQESESTKKELESKLQESTKELESIREAEAKAKRDAHIAEKMATVKFAESVKDKIKGKLDVLESIEEIDKVFESEVNFITELIKESTGVDFSGKGHTGDNHGKVNESEEFINKVMEL